MLLADSIDLHDLLRSLARRRPVFHSERDFQIEFAWQARLIDPDVEVYLETRPMNGVHLDVAFEKDGHYSAVELKYLTHRWSGTVGSQSYELKSHSAHDRGRYGVVRDIWRIEQFARERRANGAVVVLTNDPAYLSSSGRSSRDMEFRINEDARLSGLRAWRGKAPGADMIDLTLAGSYHLKWGDYAPAEPGPAVWQLVVEVGSDGEFTRR